MSILHALKRALSTEPPDEIKLKISVVESMLGIREDAIRQARIDADIAEQRWRSVRR